MSYTEIRVALGARSYPIWIGPGLLAQYTLWRQNIIGRHVLIVSNSIVAPLYLHKVSVGMEGLIWDNLILPDGETHKTLDNTARVFTALAALKANRDATVIALGGGVIGDLAGFAAACYMRGIAVVQMPTTLLAQVDSSVGGKTGVNLPSGKNLVGAFHQPRAVIIDTDTLATLPEREYRAGLAEIVKYGALGDADFFVWLEQNIDALIARDPRTLTKAIVTSCEHKAAIIARDEQELGERALLNFGHSFGHALETATGYARLLHGEAVAIGMLLAAQLSTQLGRAATGDAKRLSTLLQSLGLPTCIPSGMTAETVFAPMQLDKKNLNGQLRLILWRAIGHAEIVADVPSIEVMQLLNTATGAIQR